MQMSHSTFGGGSLNRSLSDQVAAPLPSADSDDRGTVDTTSRFTAIHSLHRLCCFNCHCFLLNCSLGSAWLHAAQIFMMFADADPTIVSAEVMGRLAGGHFATLLHESEPRLEPIHPMIKGSNNNKVVPALCRGQGGASSLVGAGRSEWGCVRQTILMKIDRKMAELLLGLLSSVSPDLRHPLIAVSSYYYICPIRSPLPSESPLKISMIRIRMLVPYGGTLILTTGGFIAAAIAFIKTMF
jgi:hypothetical protein